MPKKSATQTPTFHEQYAVLRDELRRVVKQLVAHSAIYPLIQAQERLDKIMTERGLAIASLQNEIMVIKTRLGKKELCVPDAHRAMKPPPVEAQAESVLASVAELLETIPTATIRGGIRGVLPNLRVLFTAAKHEHETLWRELATLRELT